MATIKDVAKLAGVGLGTASRVVSGKGSVSPATLARVKKAIDEVGLTKQALQRPSELSGGQRQRVAIARALVTRPRIVLADEPTANLDSATGQNILELMKHLNEVEKVTFIFSTHDPKVMERARRIVRLQDGLITDDGSQKVGVA